MNHFREWTWKAITFFVVLTMLVPAGLILGPVQRVEAAYTGWFNPTGNASVSGYTALSNPTYAYADDSNNATGPNLSSSTTYGQQYHTFGASIPSGAVLQGIEVQVHYWLSNQNGTNTLTADLSTDGTAWTSTNDSDTSEPTSQTAVILQPADPLWGRSWTSTDLTNLRVRIRMSRSSFTTGVFYLDWVSVRLRYNRQPNTPTNTYPNGQTLTTRNPTFTWSAFSDPDTGDAQDQFYIQIRQNPGSYFYRSTTVNSSANSYASSWNLPDGAYCWQVRVRDNSGASNAYSALSTETCFTVSANVPPNPPSLVDPPNGEVVITGQPTLSWNATTDPDPGDSVAGYGVSIDGGAFVNVGLNTSYVPGTPLSNGSHTWQVRACDTHAACSTSPTWSFTVNTNIVGPNQDSYVDQANPTINYGTNQYMYVRSSRNIWGDALNRRMFLRFNVPPITTCYPGTSPSIVQATLRVYADSGPSMLRTYDVYRVTGSWTEGGINWNNQPAAEASGSVNVSVGYTGWVNWDVTEDVASFIDYGGANTNYGWMIRDRSESESWSEYYETRFRAREYSGTSTDPQLLIAYNCPPAAPVLVSPANGGYTTDNTPLLDWNPATDPDGDTLRYAVQVDGGAWVSPSPDTLTEITWGTLGEGQHNWRVRVSDGRAEAYSASWTFTVDTDMPGVPAYLNEGSPDQDFYPNAAYALLINWGSVPDTGSGIAYQLQRRINGAAWTTITTTANTAYNDTASLADNDFVEYQVRACTGAGNCSGWTTSDGVRIDSQDPAIVTGVGEGVTVGTDDDWSRDNVYWVYWNRVADTGSGITYEVQRSVNGGAYAPLTLSAFACDAARCWGDDPTGYSNGDNVRYRVRAVNGAGRTSLDWSTPSDGITIDSAAPDSAVLTGGVYTPPGGANPWPGNISGSASDGVGGVSGVARVDLRIRDASTGDYWNGTAWDSAETWVQAAGTNPWSYTFPASNLTDGHTYVVDSRATDGAGNVESTYGNNNFTYASSAPDAPVPTSPTHPNPDLWYNNNQPGFVWNVPNSSVPVVGYSIILDPYPGTIPDTIQETSGTSYNAATTPDGTWYFHVRAVNIAGTWGPAGHVRVNIDTATPQTPASVTEENPDVDWDADGAINVYWSAVPNTGSGITYALERCVNGGLSGACTTGWQPVASGIAETWYAHNPGGYADGNTVRYRVRATNGVGLTGGWRESDGMTIDSSPVGAPAWVYEDAMAEPDRDYHNQANGAVTVRWATVADTGSGITYRLEKCVSLSGACTNPTDWTLVAQGLSVTFYADSGSYSDGLRVRYRVIAVNGVGTVGAPTASDGMLIDLDIPASPAWVREGVATEPDWDYDDDGAFTIYWAAVANTGSGITYRLEKSIDGADWQLVAEGLSATNYTDTNGSDDGAFIRYRVTPLNGAGTVGQYRLSDGITLDREAPAAPAWIYENNPDVDFDTDGAVLVVWAPVANTGSGITYNLQKRIDGGEWYDLAAGLTGTSFNDTDTFGDETLIEYRVQARNGVGRISGWTLSDGVLVDTDTPAAPTNVGEGLVVGTDLDYVNVNTYLVYWTGVTATATGDTIRYTVERNVNGGGWNTAVTGLTATSWDDPQAYSNGDQVLYRVIAVNGAGTASAASAASDGITIDTGQPNSTVATTGYYNSTGWPDRVQGASSDDYSGVARVEVVIYDTDANLWWNGSAWAAGGPFWLLATGTTNWYYPLTDAYLTNGHAYDLLSRATDVAGNVETSLGTNTFIFASSGPEVPVISSSTHPVQTTWYNANDPAFAWTEPGGPAPIVGYSYVLDQNPATTPDTTADTTGLTAAYTDLADGTWYFHVRAVDSTPNWGPAGHYRINIDTATPGAPATVTEESPDVDWDYDGSVTVYWTAVPNTGSGIVYVVEREVSTNPGVWTVLSDTVPATWYLDSTTGYSDGTLIRYRVSARNGVGLTGAATTSDGVTVDSDAPGTPAWVTENAPDPNDQDYDPDGSVRVYWATVADTGSGITYRLERRITVSGLPGAWVEVAAGLTGNSYLDPRLHQDGETIHYRVTAFNGVNNFGAARLSDGILIDTDTPGAPAEVTENSPDIDWSVDGSVTVFWGGVGDTGSGITYRLEKQVNSSGWVVVSGAEALPGGTTSFADGGAYNDGDVIRYRVRATNGAGTPGAWRESDGMTIDSSIPAAPGWVREENPDVDYDADGALTVYWAAVSDTGSGITYRLEKELNHSGTWTPVAQGLAGVSYYDGQAQPDGTFVRYRVTAVNGVGTPGAPTTSDGITVDTQSPATPTGVGEGDAVGTDDAFDQDNAFDVFWNAVADTGSGITYDIQKSLNGSAWVAAATGIAETFWEDPTPYSNGDTVRYRIRAVNGAGLEGSWSAGSSGITLDFVAPDSAVTTHGYYSLYSWPGFILGTAGDTGSDVAVVHLTIQRASDGQYWNGTTWQGSAVWLTATGTVNWQYTFTPADGETYDLRSRATDYAGNVEVTFGVNSFTYSSSGPQAPEIASPTHPNEAAWYLNNSPVFTWTVPSSTAPVIGYSYLLDQNPGTTPDAVPDTPATTVSYSGLADGTWYFHVRAVDDPGNWGPAGHFAVHIDTATPQTPGQPTEESPDIDFDADGAFTVYWSGVPNTGSGITYRLERDSGAGWTLVITTTATNYADSGTYADGTLIRYRVRAFNGVGLSSAWSPASDGVTIDSDVPAAPAWVREGVATDPDWDWDADGAYAVYWAAVADTGSGIQYRLYRRINGGAWLLLTTTGNLFYADSGIYPDGTLLEYQVFAVNGAGLISAAAQSDGIRIDSDVPATPATVTEESPDVDWDYDGLFTVYWSAVPNTGSGIAYRLERNLNGAGWTVLTVTAATAYADNIGNVDGTTAQYRVTAINGVGLEGAPRTSDGVTVDSQAVPQPGWVREDSATEPDRDYHPNADGAITVYWAAVADTGSGIRYRLEKRVNGGGWTTVVASVAATSYPDSGAYADNDFIEYRVTAINGVLTESTPRFSDGMRIDTDIPASPTGVGEGDVAGVDDDFDENNVYDVFWTASADTGSGIIYIIQRSRNGGAWEQAAAGLPCGGTPCRWDDPVPYSNGDTVQYRVLAVNGAGHSSIASVASDGITLDFAQPDSSVSTGGYYNAFNWPGYIQGTAADAISDVDFVDVTIRDTTNNLYWNGTAWNATLTWLRAAGTHNWQVPLAVANLTNGVTYDVRSRATDRATNEETTWGANSFTFAGQGPQAPVISSSSHPVQAAWYANNAPVFTWTVPGSVAPVVGYSYILDQNPATTPDAVADTTGNEASYTGIADGTWYLHVRAVDNTNNWGPAGHYRINIDTATPAAPTAVAEGAPDVDWDADGAFTVYWSAVPNTGSGITYALERCVDGGLSGPCTTGWTAVASGLAVTQYADSVGNVDGRTARYRVRATNGVGLSGLWTESDGVTVDNGVPGSPAPVTEGDPTPDIAYDADGAFTVYWTAVADTGSGITYRLERQVNGGGYTLVAEGLIGVSYAVSGTYNDGDLIQYRVTAVNGVGTAGSGAVSTGVVIDNQTPAAPAAVTEESPDVDWDVDGNVRVYWTAVANTGSGITYRLERRINGGSWALVPGADALTVTDLWVADTYTDNDLIEFRVRATNGVGLSSGWTQSNGVRVDSSVPATPASVTENSPDIDFLADASGTLTVYWSAVPNTGSGITYRVERELNGSGIWTLIGTTAGTSLPDSGGPYADDTLIRYRVTTVTGVGTPGTPALSDGVRIDLTTPAVPTGVGEGDTVGADDDYDQDNTFYVFWNAVPATATGDTITYIVQRNRNEGGWEQATTTAATFWEDPYPYSNGDTVRYRIIAVNGAGTQSAASQPSDGLLLDFVQPDSAVTTGGFYNAFSWPGFIYGTAADGLSGVSYVDITLRNAGTGEYWNGTGWGATPVWLRANGTNNWQYAFAPANGTTYDVQSRAADVAGNVETSYGYSSFTYASSGPQAPVVSSPTHPDQGLWYNHNDPTVNWTTPPSGAGIQGYSFVLDQNPGTTPDTVLEALVNTTSYTDLADGTWYFHVRAQDNANNWGPAGHYRINIDTTTPTAPASVTEESPDVDWDADGNVVVYWDAVSDFSGVTYTLERSINGAAYVQVATGIAGTSYPDFSTAADGATVRYRVRATNGVGLSSGWTESDGMTIDSVPPVSPAPVTEETPDIDWSATGTVIVRWTAVPNTGSGITYRLERSVNGIWTTLAPALTANSYADSGTYNDGDFIQYRVTAISGVGLAGPVATSDGMTIDSETPATSATVTEESPDVDWDYDGIFTVYWSAVPNTGSGITYRLERSLNGGPWTLLATTAATSYADNIGNTDGTTAQYRVSAVNGVGLVGGARTSDGVTVDSSVPGTPGNVTENRPDIDFYPYADGAVTVTWDPVADTGSDITYRVERRVNAGTWTVVAGGIAGTTYADSGSYADDDLITYRVTAINGVGTAGAAGTSDGVRIDLTNPAVPTGVGEGDTPGVDDTFDQDNTTWVFWTGVSATATGDTIYYTVERSRNGSPWELAGSGLPCGGTPCRWEDPVPFSNGDTVQYRVTAVNGAGRTSGPSATSSGITLDFAPPDSTVTTNGFFNAFNWPGYIQGAASDSLSDVAWVDLTIRRRSDNQYWNGTGWQAAEVWLRATGRLSWQYALGLAALTDGVTYDLRSRATDYAGNVEVTFGTGSFTFSGSGPEAPAISSATHPVQTAWYNNNDPVFTWITPTSAVPVVGYSYILDQNATTTPDTQPDTAGRTAAFTDIADGTWYFHVRATDEAGNWGPAAHYRINIDTATPAAPATITEESPDVDWDADGSVTVYWSAVPNTGSGITYRLEQNLNGGGWTLVPGAGALTGTTFTVGGFANGATVLFRVRATNGVGLSSAWTTSDGVSFDLTTPAAPTGVGEGDVVGTDDDWDQDNTFYVFWNAVAASPSGITYIVERSRNHGAWEIAATGLTATQWDDPVAYSSGETVAYRVTARTGAGRESAPSASSDGITLDFVRPDSAITTNGFYNTFTWPGYIQGTASDNLSDVAFVDITIQRQSDSLYWNGTAWVATLTWVRATGTANWQYAFTPGDGQTYLLQSRATDYADNVETTLGTSTFNYSASGPGAPVVSSPTHPDPALWYNHNAPTFNWTTPPSGAGINGYSYVLDQTPDTEPDLTADTTGNSRSYTNIADGVWYFHVRAVDNAGNWGSAGHFRVNIDTTPPAAPASLIEESPDVDWDADGNITLYWHAVTHISPVTYDLQRTTDGGATWVNVATGITTTVYLDPLTHPDGTVLRYRVRAVDAVALTGGWTQSDGVTVDSETPAQPTGLGEGDIVGTDDAYDQDNTFYVFWDAVPDTGSGIVYTIERRVNGAAWQTVQTNYAQTFWEDPQVFADCDSVQYRVTAINGVGTVGPASVDSSGITLDFIAPDTAISTSGTYGPASWPGWIAGTATDATSGVALVHITLQRQSDGQYWNGVAWVGAPVWLLASGTTAWTYTFAPANGETYNVRSRATDVAGNVEVSYGVSSFTYTTNEPDSSVTTGGLYVGGAWPGQIAGTAVAPMALVDFVDLTLQRQSDGLYWNGTAWGATPVWLRATGTNPWSYTFAPADGETYLVRSRATDAVGNVETVLGSGTFSYDAAAPEITAIAVTSDSPYFYNPGLTADGGTVYFNSRDGEGAGQTLTVDVAFTEPHPASLIGSTAFGDTPPADTVAPWTVQYTVETFAGTQSNVLFTVADTLGLTDTAALTFIQDNLPPASRATIVDDATNVTPIVVEWEADDAASGLREVHLWAKFQPIGAWMDTGLVMTGPSGSFTYTPTQGTGTYYFATVGVDQVGNAESVPTGFGDDQVDFDGSAPASTLSAPAYTAVSPIPITWSADFDAKYTYLYYRYGESGGWLPVTFSTAKNGVFAFEPTDGEGHYYFATVAMDAAGNREPIAENGKALTIYDVTAPASAASSPDSVIGFNVPVTWVGDDGALGSGIATYDVQYKKGADGTWTDLITHTVLTNTLLPVAYEGEEVVVYYFRSRATDHAGNQEAWPEAPEGDSATTVTFGAFVGKYRLHLPLVARSYGGPALPDLVVTAIQVTPAEPTAGQTVDLAVTIKNQGNAATQACFWIDLYINPKRLPITVNQGWFEAGSDGGLVWSICGLAAGESVTLHYNDTHYWPTQSQFSGSFAAPGTQTLYAQVDSWNPETTYGAVYESNEQNNVFGPQALIVRPLQGMSVAGETVTPVAPPQRPSLPPH